MGAREDKERKARIKRHSYVVAAYIECREQFQKGTAPSFFNLQSDTEFDSCPPSSSYLERFYADEDNKHAAKRIDPILRRMEALGSLLEPFRRVEGHPGLLKHWRASETADDRYWMQRFDALCRAVAELLERDYPGEEIRVNRAPDDYEPPSAGSLKQAAAQDREERQKEQHAETHRRRYAEFLKLSDEHPGSTRDALKALWSDREKKKNSAAASVPTIERAIRFAERHEWPDGKPVELHLRWEEEKGGAA